MFFSSCDMSYSEQDLTIKSIHNTFTECRQKLFKEDKETFSKYVNALTILLDKITMPEGSTVKSNFFDENFKVIGRPKLTSGDIYYTVKDKTGKILHLRIDTLKFINDP